MTNLSSDDCCDYYEENELNSPTDTSEDSVDVKVSPILSKNKRKCLEPRRTIPLKKRICFKARHPFRPWSPPPTPPPLLLATEKPSTSSYFRPPSPAIQPQTADEEQIRLPDDVRVPIHPIASEANSDESERMILDASCDAFPDLKSSLRRGGGGGGDHQRNYKNMTRERRIEANARERTRVHTISAAFDTLRKSIPAYSHNQKLSKLSVLRIACSYIMTLSSMIDDDGDGDYSTAECVDLVSKTIQREGKLRKKKDDND